MLLGTALGGEIRLCQNPIWGGSGGVLGSPGESGRESGGVWGGLGAPCEKSGTVLERSWKPSCGNVIFERFLVRFWGRLGRPRG